jgi:hypothetical protein
VISLSVRFPDGIRLHLSPKFQCDAELPAEWSMLRLTSLSRWVVRCNHKYPSSTRAEDQPGISLRLRVRLPISQQFIPCTPEALCLASTIELVTLPDDVPRA